MSHICPHGRRIFSNWRECPECSAAEDIYEASWAARETAEETKKQTRILEDLAYQREQQLDEAAKKLVQSKFIESQEMARLAEERFRMGDLLGALQLINKAIESESSFTSFYYQRARYLATQGKTEQAVSDLRNFCRATPENFVEVENQLKSGKLNEFSSIKSDFEALIHQIKGHARTQARDAISIVEAEAAKMRSKFKEGPAPDFVDRAVRSLSRLKQLGENDSYVALLGMPKIAEEVRNEIEQAKSRYDDLQNRARESLAKAELKLKLISTSRGNEFAPEKLHSSQNNLTEAKKLFQNPSYNTLLRCLEISEQAIKDAEAGRSIIEGSLARQRKSFEETLLKTNSQHELAVSLIKNKYDERISEYEEIEKARERYSSKNTSGLRGCSNLFLWIAAFFIGHFLTRLGVILPHPRNLEDVIISTGLWGVIVYVIIRYLIPLIFRQADKISRIHTKQKIKELTHIRDEKIAELQSGFIYNSDIIALSKKLKSLVEYEDTNRSPALIVAEQILSSQAKLKGNLPASPVRKYRNIRLAKIIIYSSICITIFMLIIYLVLKKTPKAINEQPPTSIGLVTAQIANIRSGPSQNSSVIAKAQLGDTLVVVSIFKRWVLVKYKNMEGYIYDDLLRRQDFIDIKTLAPRQVEVKGETKSSLPQENQYKSTEKFSATKLVVENPKQSLSQKHITNATSAPPTNIESDITQKSTTFKTTKKPEEKNILIEEPPPDFVPFEKEPRIVKRVQPIYPEIARKDNIEGTVWVKIWVTKEGKAKKAIIQKSESDILDQAAIDAAMQFVFTPATIKNEPVDVWMSIPFKFTK